MQNTRDNVKEHKKKQYKKEFMRHCVRTTTAVSAQLVGLSPQFQQYSDAEQPSKALHHWWPKSNTQFSATSTEIRW
jgi:hypothetical protein